MPVVESLVASAETVLPGSGPLRGARSEEAAVLLRWLRRGGVRLVRTSTPYSEPARCAGPWRSWLDRVTTASELEHLAHA